MEMTWQDLELRAEAGLRLPITGTVVTEPDYQEGIFGLWGRVPVRLTERRGAHRLWRSDGNLRLDSVESDWQLWIDDQDVHIRNDGVVQQFSSVGFVGAPAAMMRPGFKTIFDASPIEIVEVDYRGRHCWQASQGHRHLMVDVDSEVPIALRDSEECVDLEGIDFPAAIDPDVFRHNASEPLTPAQWLRRNVARRVTAPHEDAAGAWNYPVLDALSVEEGKTTKVELQTSDGIRLTLWRIDKGTVSSIPAAATRFSTTDYDWAMLAITPPNLDLASIIAQIRDSSARQ
ncbi:hypothetical protein [Gordonia sp. CPCC 205333]|uniref:hypothetical protein n=1 Tax=Gordonia sp. CPCC 205333 TaxID=3140790 RepID=UPI003AF3B471